MQVCYNKVMKIKERAYCAGIIDGEGTISITARHQWTGNHAYLVRCVSKSVRVTNTDLRLLEWLQQTTGYGKVTKLWQNPNPKYDRFRASNIKPLYAWAIWGKNIKPFLRAILPYLVVKHRHAELMLESLALSWQRGDGKAYAEPIWQRQLEINNEFRVLNKRGL